MVSHDITTLESLKDHLFSAMVLEHATLPVYLTALYSIKPERNLDAFNIIRVVAVEEMLHLTFAANLLNAIGGDVDLTKKGFVPDYPTFIPDSIEDFKVHLGSFSQDSLETFLKIERPTPPGSVQERVVDRRIPHHNWCISPHKDGKTQYATIGEFYNAIKDGVEFLEKEAQTIGGTIFVGNPANQITAEFYYSGGGKLFSVTDLSSAVRAINLVIDQGEGYVQDDKPSSVYDQYGEIAHFYRFEQLKLRQYYIQGDMPGRPSGPDIKIDWLHGVYETIVDPKVTDYPEGSELRKAAFDFNCAYAEFLKLLTRAYNGERELLTSKAVPAMFEFRNLMIPLIRNLMPNQNGRNAAPTFEIDAAWDALSGEDKF